MTNKIALLFLAVVPIAVCTCTLIWHYFSACDIVLTIMGAEAASATTSRQTRSANSGGGVEMRRVLSKDQQRRVSRVNSVFSVVSRMNAEARRQLYFLVATPLASIAHTMPLFVLLAIEVAQGHANLNTTVAAIVCIASQGITRAMRLFISHPELLNLWRQALRRLRGASSDFAGPLSEYSAHDPLDALHPDFTVTESVRATGRPTDAVAASSGSGEVETRSPLAAPSAASADASSPEPVV